MNLMMTLNSFLMPLPQPPEYWGARMLAVEIYRYNLLAEVTEL